MKRDRLLGLDLIRGLCAVAVMIYHYCHLAKWGDPYAMGTFGVYIFFVLSGFALYYVYGQKQVDEQFLRNFFVSRFLRIMPLFVAVAVYRMWGKPLDDYNFVRLLVHATPLIGIADVAAFSKVMVGGWSILIEWSFYLLFPFMMLFRRMGSVVAMFVLAMVINYNYVKAAYFPPAYMRAGDGLPYTDTLTFLCFFVGGMLAAKFFLEAPNIVLRMQKVRRPLFWALGCVALIFALPALYPYEGRIDFLSGADASLLVLLTIALVFLAAMEQPEGRLAKASTFLGDVSFAAYLLHVYVWNFVGKRLDPPDWLQFTISVPLTLFVSFFVYKYFERPVRDIRKWWPRRYGGLSGP
jgi:peptidoglycan/LPS O-acetylase OafA/YrhL